MTEKLPDLSWVNLVGFTSDGIATMTGNENGLAALTKKMLHEQNPFNTY